VDTAQPRTPGFPLFLLAAGTGRAFFLISIGLHMAAVALLAVTLRRIGVGYKLRLAFAVVAILPPFVQKDAYLLTEGITEFLLVAGFAVLWLGKDSRLAALWSGLAFALASITRPQNQLLPVAVGALMLLYLGRRRAWKRAAALLLPSVVLIGGLIVHNYVRFGYPSLTYLLGYHLGTKTVTLYEKIDDPQIRDIMVAARNDAYLNRNQYWATWYSRSDLMAATGLSRIALAGRMQKIHLRLIAAHPLAYLEEVARALCHFWSPDLPEQSSRPAPVQFVSMVTQLALCGVFWLTMVLWAGLSMGRFFLKIPEWLPDRYVRLLYTTALAMVAYTALISCALDIGEPRYRGPVDLLLLFVVATTLHFLARSRTVPTQG
jgi:hypothetical protein